MEHDLQKWIISYLRKHNVLVIETDIMDGLKFLSNPKTRIAYINHHKAMGWIKGTPDLIIFETNGKYRCVELKDGNKYKQSAEQKEFEKKIQELNGKYEVWTTFGDAVEYVENLREQGVRE